MILSSKPEVKNALSLKNVIRGEKKKKKPKKPKRKKQNPLTRNMLPEGTKDGRAFQYEELIS